MQSFIKIFTYILLKEFIKNNKTHKIMTYKLFDKHICVMFK